MSKFTKFLNLFIPGKTDKGSVVTDVFEPNFSKIDDNAESTDLELKRLEKDKLDKGLVSEEYDTAKKIEDKIKEAKKAGTDAGTEANKKLDKGNVQTKYDTAEKIGNEIDKKFDKGSLPAKISDAKDLYDLIQNNSGLNFDENLLFLNDAGTKYVNKIYFDRNKKGLFKCISQTTSTTNSTSYFVDISNEANSAQLRNLFETGSNSNGSWVKNKLTGKYKVFIPAVYFAQDQARVVSLPIKLSSNRYLVFTHTNLSWDGGNSNHFGIYNLTQTSFSAAYRGVAANISFMIEEY